MTSEPHDVDTGVPPNPSTRRGRFYHETVILEVEGVLHRVYRYGFEKWSFHDVFAALLQGDSPGAGESDDNPIQLKGCTNEEFESLLEVMYPLDLVGPPLLAKDQWVGVLRLSRLWDMPNIATLAIEKLSACSLTAVEKIVLGKAHGVPTWLKEGYTALVNDLTQASIEEVSNLGWETAFRVLWVREGISKIPEPQSASEQYFCWFCKNSYSRLQVIAGPNARCDAYCGNTNTASNVVKAITANGATPIATTAEEKLEAITEKVSQVFAEELRDAERRNATTVS